MKSVERTILIINGSASRDSSNARLIDHLSGQLQEAFRIILYDGLKTLPHFDPELSLSEPPQKIIEFRALVEKASGVIICTPEYVFSVPSGLKNAIEWCVSTTVFSDKPMGIITASANGRMAHEELQLIMRTVQAHFSEDTTLLINGVKGKVNILGEITDSAVERSLNDLVNAFAKLCEA